MREHHLTTRIIMKIEMHQWQHTNVLQMATCKQLTSLPNEDKEYCCWDVAIYIKKWLSWDKRTKFISNLTPPWTIKAYFITQHLGWKTLYSWCMIHRLTFVLSVLSLMDKKFLRTIIVSLVILRWCKKGCFYVGTKAFNDLLPELKSIKSLLIFK